MRQVYFKDLIKQIPVIGGGNLDLFQINNECPYCHQAISFIKNPDNKEIINVGDCKCPQFVPSQGTIADRTNYRVSLESKDVSSELHLKNGKANPFGWSQYEVWHNDKQIGWLESGALDISKEYIVEERIGN